MKEIREHFMQSGYQRLFHEARKKWESVGRVGGKIRLKQISEEEQRRISGLLGIGCRSGEDVEIKLSELDERLKETRWTIGLEELLPLLTGQPLVSKKQQREARVSAWETFCLHLLSGCRMERTKAWWKSISDGEAHGTKTLKQMFEQSADRARQLAITCLRALDELPYWSDSFERLPVFANRICGNPHGFDADTAAGRLLYLALCDLFGIEPENTAEWKREVLQEAGLYMDDLTSYVMALGIETMAEDPWHAAFEQARRTRVPLLLPLAFFQQKVIWKQSKKLFVVENPSVFQSVIDRWPQGMTLPPLVCSSGQPSVAAIRLLDVYAAMGTQICYSGDFDWKGIEIACSLRKRYGLALVPWRMGVEEYVSRESAIAFEEEGLKNLSGLPVSWDERLVPAILKRKYKLYQESLLDLMVEDLAMEMMLGDADPIG